MIYDTSLDTTTDANLSKSHKRAPKSQFNQSCGALPLTVVYGILVSFIRILLRVIGYMFFIISCKVLFVVWVFNRLYCFFLALMSMRQPAHCCGSLSPLPPATGSALMMLRCDPLEVALLYIAPLGLKWYLGGAERRKHAGWADIMLFS